MAHGILFKFACSLLKVQFFCVCVEAFVGWPKESEKGLIACCVVISGVWDHRVGIVLGKGLGVCVWVGCFGERK